ncbi:MAG: RagB/SusD family nutrient uptake outer membrane protein [Mangrovibacterium sp.]|nr:RagB/SusD family nutrient uptake outer membrane protein [Mangrovibacterium sp.]
MKKVINNPLSKVLLFLMILMITSCEDYLEVTPKNKISDLSVWTSKANAELFLNGIYGIIPDEYNTGDNEEFYTDNILNTYGSYFSRATYALGAYTPSNGPSKWGLYTSIRKCNVFITNVAESGLEEPWRTLRLGEARFVRAYLYMLLWTRHGGVPIITDVLNQSTQGDEIFRARNTFEETYQFIINECAEIIPDLPVKAAENGRVTKGAALTLKAFCELFYASPLYNTTNDLNRWKTAAATYKQVIDLNTYTLFSNLGTLFLESNNYNSEVIFSKGKKGGTSLGGSREGLWGPLKVNNVNKSFGYANPTQDLVDQYFMANGLPITDPGSGYDPQNPYLNREKRFYNDILYDGATWLGYPVYFWIGSGDEMTFDFGDAGDASNTGYAYIKGLNTVYANTFGDNRLSSANYIIYRYAEVLLSYAEAQNEAEGPDASVYSAVNQVRARISLPGLPAGLTKAQMREAIRHERRVELAMEDKRWVDLIRWKTAEDVLNGTVHAMRIEKVDGIKQYTVVPAPGGTKIFDASKHYLWPIPQSAMDRNEILEQNPNY